MSELDDLAQSPVVPLAPIARARRRVARGVAWTALIAVLATKFLFCRARDPDCTTAAHTMNDAIAVVVCERQYVRTGDPTAGALLADAQRRSGNPAVASAIANGLLVTRARGDAFGVLGRIAASENRLDAAMSALENARDFHRAEANHRELARDDQAIAGVLQARYQHAPALRALDECLAEARAAADPVIEGYCHLSTARVMSQIGSFESAQQQFDLAKALFHGDRELAWLAFERGNLEQELHRSPVPTLHHDLALASFEEALALAHKAQLPRLVVSAELNLAYSLTASGKLDEAERHLAAADLIDRDNAYVHERAQQRAEIAYHRGDLALAASIYESLYPVVTEPDDRIDIAAMLARIALGSRDLARAEQWARRGMAGAEEIRAAQRSPELRAWVLSTRREPYELLFSTLARAGRFEEAVQAFDQWQGRSLLDALSRPLPRAPFDLRSAAARIENFGAWIPAVVAAPLLQTAPGRLAIAEVRSTDVLALVIADAELWRVTSGGGRLDVVDLGPITSFQPRFERFEAAPTDLALAEELGQALVPDAVFRATHQTLRVVLDGPLMGLPIVALRHHGRPLIAARPVVHAPRISVLACAPAARSPRHALALADAAGDLPDARAEAEELARLFGGTSAVGAGATSAALFSAGRGNLLHVAVHADIDASGGFLALYDQKLHALDISGRRLGPGLVVLSACVSALSNDLELAGSLASAFLAAGSTQVVATLRPVSDAGARALFSRFYQRGGAHDPVRALASVQAELASSPTNTDWPSFAVFGRDLCTTTP
jgi:tetratricopeptide (TPR) repeat protein